MAEMGPIIPRREELERQEYVVIRSRDWDKIDNMLKRLYRSNMDFEIYGFGCISLHRDSATLLKSEGHDLEEVDFSKVLGDKVERERYVSYRNSVKGIAI